MKHSKLYIGTNYHPHDWSEERWKIDIELMKKAGFELVRLGHLAWDSYEPDDGIYTFEWFDKVMDLFAEASIRVVLDISTRPAPVWVHEKCPGCRIHDKAGQEAPAVRRYMEDVSDPDYQHYALRFARVLVERYREHPALFAFGLCNEQGAGYASYSPASLQRFKDWLKEKYETVENLNKAWATQRWCRRLRSFDDVLMPVNSVEVGSPEAWLDMRRFFSDGVGQYMVKLARLVEEFAPGVPHPSNHYSGHRDLGFDLLKYDEGFVDYAAMGDYPSFFMDEKVQYTFTIMQERLHELDTPMWFLEFETGFNAIFSGPDGYIRMQAFLCLQHRLQLLLGWTWRTMLGGEEQFFHGLLGHDGVPTPVYHEYACMARDFRKLEKYAFPYLPKVEIGVAYSQESWWAQLYNTTHYAMPYTQGILYAQKALFAQNRDYNIVDLRRMKKDYKLLLVPNHIVMEPAAAAAIRSFVEKGGTVLMTGYSAVVDETSKAFDTFRPGLLSDVFGLRVAGFDRAGLPDRKGNMQSRERTITRGDQALHISTDYVERLELHNARCYAGLDNGQCAVSVHQYGKGKAYYLAPEANAELFDWLLRQLADELQLTAPPASPEGVQARQIAPGQVFYVNTTNAPVSVPLAQPGHGVLTDRDYRTEMMLAPYDGELVVSAN
nr:beta-galactosidase [Clostridia bacterium]